MDPTTLMLATGACALAMCITVAFAVRAFLAGRAAEDDGPAPEAERMAEPDGRRFTGIARLMRPDSPAELSLLRSKLAQAGLRSPDAIDLFGVTRGISMLVGVGLFLVLASSTGFGAGGMFLGTMVLTAAAFGPKVWLNLKAQTRQEALALSLPPTLDLLVTCMEAGLGLEQALSRVANEIDRSDPEMAEELSVVVGELSAGLSTGAAFRKLSERVTSDELRNLSNVIVQSSSLGASLGRTLREYASSARRRRELTLEEVAGKVTAGLTLPLTLCLLPSAVLAMLGPAVVIIAETLFAQ